MKKSWYILIIGAIGWTAVLIADFFGFSIKTSVSSSINYILTTIVAVGLAIPFIETAIDNAGKHIANAVSRFQPDIEKGFSRLVDTIQKFELDSELRDLQNYLPHYVKYLQNSRTYNLEPDGSAIITAEYIIKNISDRNLNKIILPIFGFGAETYDQTQDYDQLLELSINGKKIDTPIEAIRKINLHSSPSDLDGVTQPQMIECCYRVPVDLKSNHTVSIQLKFRNFFFATPMFKLDLIGARVYDITEKLVLRIISPDNHTIKIVPTSHLQKGITVFHIATEDEEADEITRISRPEVIGNKEVYWHVESPLIGYAYVIRYQVQKN